MRNVERESKIARESVASTAPSIARSWHLCDVHLSFGERVDKKLENPKRFFIIFQNRFSC